MVTRVFKVYGLPRYKYFEPDRKCKEIYSDASALRINETGKQNLEYRSFLDCMTRN